MGIRFLLQKADGLAGPGAHGTGTEFVPDIYAETSRSTYSINSGYLNPVIQKKWEKERLSVLGVGHSHPHGSSAPSKPDIEYFTDLLKTMPRKHFFTPIIFAIPDGGLNIFYYVFTGDQKHPVKTTLEVVPDNYEIPAISENFRIPQEEISPMALATQMPKTQKIKLLVSSANLLLLFSVKLFGVGVLAYLIVNILPPFMNLIIKFLTS